jgi:hypothetical protein
MATTKVTVRTQLVSLFDKDGTRLPHGKNDKGCHKGRWRTWGKYEEVSDNIAEAIDYAISIRDSNPLVGCIVCVGEQYIPIYQAKNGVNGTTYNNFYKTNSLGLYWKQTLKTKKGKSWVESRIPEQDREKKK